MSTQSSVAVRIAGHEYKIKSDGDASALREIAGYVDRAMERVRERTGTVDTIDVAVLTCLNLAREIVALRGRTADASLEASEQDEKLRALIERVEETLGDAAPAATRAAERADDSLEAEAADTGEETGRDAPQEASEGARTIELPSVETLRDRGEDEPATSEDGQGEDASLPPARVAAGGRDRAS